MTSTDIDKCRLANQVDDDPEEEDDGQIHTPHDWQHVQSVPGATPVHGLSWATVLGRNGFKTRLKAATASKLAKEARLMTCFMFASSTKQKSFLFAISIQICDESSKIGKCQSKTQKPESALFERRASK